ncbi:hypothetical protein AA309_12040 [Microvirga vignae]|uniref:Uncharacterized protein n=1 Tax=Microvirga vignae TaxID=1225564 RepID=A0A0H1RCR4_9HYPH|nr:hypothetical protein [Microvirga vignae]KLK92849.1 hypothetical protein AA309_12040 [Microvirga vignae]
MPNARLREDPETCDTLARLGRLWATMAEAASFFDVTERSLYRAFKRHPRLREAFDRGQALGRIDLRRRLFASNDPQVMVHLAKNLLEMPDRVEAKAPPRPLSDADLLRILNGKRVSSA